MTEYIGSISNGNRALFEFQSGDDLGQVGVTGYTRAIDNLGVGEYDPKATLAWQSDALCAQIGPEVFFPKKGGKSLDPKKVCYDCEVRVQCLDYALEKDERFGIWGGLSAKDRQKVQKRGLSALEAVGSPEFNKRNRSRTR